MFESAALLNNATQLQYEPVRKHLVLGPDLENRLRNAGPTFRVRVLRGE